MAILLHLIAWQILRWFEFNAVEFFSPFFHLDVLPSDRVFQRTSTSLQWAGLYSIITAVVSFGLGYVLALVVAAGKLRFLVTHKWVYDLTRDNSRLVTAYVLTKTMCGNRLLMYSGRLSEFFLAPDGRLSYVVLKDCARFYMTLGEDGPTTGERLELFRDPRPADKTQVELPYN